MRIIKVCIISIVLSLSSLSSTQMIEGEARSYSLDELRNIFAKFNAETSLVYYNNDAYGEEIDTTKFLSEYSYILTDRTLLQSLWNSYNTANDPELKESYMRFYKELSSDIIWQNLRSYTDEYYNLEASLEVYINDETIAIRDVGNKIYLSDDREYRKKLYEATKPLTIHYFNPLLQTIIERQREICKELGFNDYVDYWQKIHNIDFSYLSTILDRLLSETDEIFRDILYKRVEETFDFDISEIKPYDRGQLFRLKGYDDYFKANDMLQFIKRFLLGLGIDLDNQKNIKIDFDDIPEKSARASTYIIKVPEDIRVLGKPSAGIEDYTTLFHEMGHAQHYANCKERYYEFKLLGDGGITEGYAFLFDSLFMEPKFLIEEVGVPFEVAKKIIWRNLFTDLTLLRYYISLFNFERFLHKGDGDPVKFYRDIMVKNLLLPKTTEDAELGYLSANEDFYSVYYLEAWFLSAMLRDYLKSHYGERWYKNKGAGKFLIELWNSGERYNTVEIAKRLGYDGLDIETLIKTIKERYEFATK
ncbi:MAG: hypothetical protein ACUVWP_02415 [bacterium]